MVGMREILRIGCRFFLYSLILFCIFLVKPVFAIPTDGLVLHVTFDGCIVRDESGHVSNFQIHGSPQCVEGISGNAFYFDGDDWIGADTFFPIVQGTVIVFVKISSLPSPNEFWTILDSKTNFRSIFLIGYPSDGNSPFLRIGYPRINLDSSLLNQWLMLTVVYTNGNTDYGKRIAYLNGQKVEEQTGHINEYTIPWYGSSNTSNLNIGVQDDFVRFLKNVAVDEIIFYNRPLSQQEIQQIYQEIIGSGSSSEYEEGFEAGKEWCREHPAECGVEVVECPPCECPVSSTEQCVATFDMMTNTLRIPNFQNQYWLEFGLINWDPIQLELKSYGPIER